MEANTAGDGSSRAPLFRGRAHPREEQLLHRPGRWAQVSDLHPGRLGGREHRRFTALRAGESELVALAAGFDAALTERAGEAIGIPLDPDEKLARPRLSGVR